MGDRCIVPAMGDKCIMPAMKVPAGYSYNRHQHWHRSRRTTYDSDGNPVYHYSEKAEQELVMRKKSGSHDEVVYSHRRYEHHTSTSSGHSSSGGGSKTTKITHFSHKHSLYKYKFLEEDEIICDICETDILGSCYGCKDCAFFIHKSCRETPKEIKHKSHHSHSLNLRSTPNHKSGKFRCDACWKTSDGFHYRCSTCKYDLHVQCAGLPSTVKYREHKHLLKLYYDFPIDEDRIFKCRVCHTKINKNGWVYYCRDNNIIAHVDCAFGDGKKDDPILVIQERLQSLQMKC